MAMTAAPCHDTSCDRWSNPGSCNNSGYEMSREMRIKENIIRMEKLGIFDLSLKLKSSAVTPKSRNKSIVDHATPRRSPYLPSEPSRRSSRLQKATPVNYSEQVEISKRERRAPRGSRTIYMEEGSKPEVYTEEHDKLLGHTDKVWPLFVDGCGKDGRRIYDSLNGKTCHQCRQKTLGHRTHCIQCNMVQGQFCGDCLYMRYGENVLEAKQNPEWKCPVCRGICNCSLCRQARGWAPTGSLYRKVLSLGFKSVAHYLIQTRREDTFSEKAKRSLPFSDGDEDDCLSEDFIVANAAAAPAAVSSLKGKEMVAVDSIAGRMKRRRGIM